MFCFYFLSAPHPRIQLRREVDFAYGAMLSLNSWNAETVPLSMYAVRASLCRDGENFARVTLK